LPLGSVLSLGSDVKQTSCTLQATNENIGDHQTDGDNDGR
jgi:hypothetical protein